MQIPTWESRLINLELAASSKDYCDEISGTCREAGVEITELSTHLQGQLVAAHPAYGAMFDAFAPESIHGNESAKAASSIAKWAASLGYKGMQIPTWESRLINLDLAASSKDYCDEISGTCRMRRNQLSLQVG